jgi:hypothetical protein
LFDLPMKFFPNTGLHEILVRRAFCACWISIGQRIIVTMYVKVEAIFNANGIRTRPPP